MPETAISTQESEEAQLQKDMKRAAYAAADYFADMMSATNTIVGNIRLEEIEQFEKDGKSYWRVTISFLDNGTCNSIQSLYGNNQDRRIYKVITITSDDFVAISMRDRT